MKKPIGPILVIPFITSKPGMTSLLFGFAMQQKVKEASDNSSN
jgi:hypothetical protein